MQDPFSEEICIAINNLAENIFGFLGVEFFGLVKEIVEVTMGTVLGYNIIILVCLDRIIEFDNVGMVENSMHFDLLL